MSLLHFQYEISVDEYVAAQLLCYKLRGRRRYIERAASWGFAGAFCVVTAVHSTRTFSEGAFSLPLLLLGGIGIWWMWAALGIAFPAGRFRRAYLASKLAETSYKADVDENGFAVAREFCECTLNGPVYN